MKLYQDIIKTVSSNVYKMINEAFDFNTALDDDNEHNVVSDIANYYHILADKDYIPKLFKSYGIKLPEGQAIDTKKYGYVYHTT